MVFIAATLIVLAVLTSRHLRTRQPPGLQVGADGRFYIYSGFSMVAIGASLMATSPAATDGEWAVGSVWTLAGLVAIVRGFDAADKVRNQQQSTSQTIESIFDSEKV